MIERDVRGLACPGPVIELRKLLDAGTPTVRMLVGDELARSNVSRFATSRGAEVSTEAAPGGGFTVTIQTTAPTHATTGDDSARGRTDGDGEAVECPAPRPALATSGPLVVQISSETMGGGDAELGRLLMRSFVKTQLQLERLPDTVLLYSSGVRLACEGSDLLGDLEEIVARGTEVLACGTCLSFYELAPKLMVGRVTDMLEIAGRLAGAGRIVRP